MSTPKKRKLHAVPEAKENKSSKLPRISTRAIAESKNSDASIQRDSHSGIRTLLADLKSGTLSHTPVQHRLDVLSQRSFPRSEEWTLLYLTNALAREQQNPQDLDATWFRLIIVMDKIHTGRLEVLLKRVDLVALIVAYLQTANSSYLALTSISGLVEKLLEHRKTRRLLTTTFDRASLALVSCLNVMCSTSSDLSSCGPLIDVLLHHVQTHSSHKKLIDFMQTQCLQALVKLMNIRGPLESCERLLQASVFSENEFNNIKLTRAALSSCDPGPGMECLCSMSFSCANLELRNHSKRLSVRNILLEMWLSLVGSTQVAQILTIYKETQIGPKVTRPLSTDTAIRTSIQNILKVTFSSQDRGAPIVSTLLQLDLDLVLPNEEEALWSYIDQCQDYHLLAKCLQAYVDIRSLPSFFTCLLKLQKVSTSLITKSFSNSLANEVSRLTEAVQDGIMQIVVQSVSLLKEPLLVALIGGLHPGSSVLPRYLAMLSITDLDGRLKRVIALKCRAGSSKLIKSIANTATTKETNSAECETWLRLKEVQSTSTIQDDDEKNDSIWIDLLLSTISQNIGFFVAVVRRWLPAVVPLMSSSQRLSFVRVVLSKIDDERITEIMFQESVLLEIPELHGVLQDEILNTLTSDTTPLYKIPTDFFHKAVKRQIVTSLASQPSLNELQCQMLLKYAYTGIYPMFAEAGDYLKFANSSLASNTTLPISMASTQEQLRRKYIKTLSQTQCKDIIEDKSCNALLQLEVVEECLTSNDLLDAAKKLSLAIRNSIFKDNYSSTDLHTQAIVLLRLLKTFRKLDIETSFLAESQEDRPVAQWLSLIKLKPDAQMSHTYLELAAWQVASVEDALNVIQGALQHATIETSFLDEMFQGFSYCLSVEMLQSLLAERTLESIPKHRAHLLLEVVQNKSRTDVLSSPWIRQQFKKTCHDLIRCQGDDELLTALNILQTLLETHARALDITSIDDLCECIQQCLQTDSTSSMLTQTYGLHRLLRATFQHHAYRLKDRYHIIILLFQRLLTVCLRKPTEMAKEETESFVRLFETFLVSSRALSINPEQFNRAVAKHVPWLLIEYIDGVTSSDFSDKISVQTKKTVEEGLVYECMSLCGQHEREMVATSLDSAGRGMFKRLFEDWSKFGRWTER